MIYRNKKLLKLAQHAPHCMCCGKYNTGDVVAAHSNWHGKGMGIKCSDALVAFMCQTCHTDLDNGKTLSREQRKEMWLSAYLKTMQWIIESGHFVVSKPLNTGRV